MFAITLRSQFETVSDPKLNRLLEPLHKQGNGVSVHHI